MTPLEKTEYQELWAAGLEDSVNLLLKRIIELVSAGGGAVDVNTAAQLEITYLGVLFTIEPDSDGSGFWIHAPTMDMNHSDWNRALNTFYENIIEPLKDRIGGVATGIGVNSQ